MEFREKVKISGYPLEDFILDSSSVMGFYKLRKVNDLDYLSLNGRCVSLPGVDNHGDYAHFYKDSVEDLIRNPRNHLYIMGVKCITLNVLCGFKEKRGEKKDEMDITLIRQKQRDAFSFVQFLAAQKVNCQICIRNLKAGTRVFLEKHNIYFFTKYWHWLRGEGFQ